MLSTLLFSKGDFHHARYISNQIKLSIFGDGLYRICLSEILWSMIKFIIYNCAFLLFKFDFWQSSVKSIISSCSFNDAKLKIVEGLNSQIHVRIFFVQSWWQKFRFPKLGDGPVDLNQSHVWCQVEFVCHADGRTGFRQLVLYQADKLPEYVVTLW